VIGQGEPRPMTDLQVLLLSVPHALGTRIDTIPGESPYLFVPPDYARKWRDAVPARGRPRIGLVASGNPRYRDDAVRSVALARLAPLLALGGIDWYWLQPETRDDELDVLLQYPDVRQIGARFADFGDTAAVIDQLDLVISVDTAVAHVAGALGKPVWLMVPFQADWRWMLDREDSPWYPSLRLFRQARPGAWDEVVQAVAAALRARTAHSGEA
jgi:ADP-heptose:LPS heptosyltransferase